MCEVSEPAETRLPNDKTAPGSARAFLREAAPKTARVFSREIAHAAPRNSHGDRLRIIPNHICVVMNLHERVYGIRGEEVEQVVPVAVREAVDLLLGGAPVLADQSLLLLEEVDRGVEQLQVIQHQISKWQQAVKRGARA